MSEFMIGTGPSAIKSTDIMLKSEGGTGAPVNHDHSGAGESPVKKVANDATTASGKALVNVDQLNLQKFLALGGY